MEKEDRLLLAAIEDRIRQCERNYETVHTTFLDVRQAALASDFCRKQADVILLSELPDGTYRDLSPDGSGRMRALFYGGYPDAERRLLFLIPEYTPLSEVLPSEAIAGAGGASRPSNFFSASEAENPHSAALSGAMPDAPLDALPDTPPDAPLDTGTGIECPIAVLRAETGKGSRKLTHRDYLGSLLSLGIKREVTGDILVREDGAGILILRDIADFLLANYEKAGHTSLALSIVGLQDLNTGAVRTEEKRVAVASLRLDSLLSAAFGLSRGKAQEAIRSGIVLVNSRVLLKPDFLLQEGDKMVLRGRGKAVLREVSGRTKKDRTFVILERYL